MSANFPDSPAAAVLDAGARTLVARGGTGSCGWRWRAAAGLLAASALLAAAPAAAAERNNGSDPTRPRTMLQPLYRYENLPGGAPDSQSTFLLRGQGWLAFAPRWSTSLRLDVPLVLTNAGSSDDPAGRFVFGSGDLLTQLAVIYTIDARWAAAAGSQLTFPSASRAETGAGTYGALPGAVVRCMLPELGAGSFFSPEVLYQFDFGGGAGAAPVRALQIQPTLDVELPRGFFLNLFPSPDIRIDLEGAGRGRLFFPLDVMAGLEVTSRLAAMLEVSVPLVKDYPVYDFKLEARVRWFFD